MSMELVEEKMRAMKLSTLLTLPTLFRKSSKPSASAPPRMQADSSAVSRVQEAGKINLSFMIGFLSQKSAVQYEQGHQHGPRHQNGPGVGLEAEAVVQGGRLGGGCGLGLGRLTVAQREPVGINGRVCAELGVQRDLVALQCVGVPALETVAGHRRLRQAGQLAGSGGGGDHGDAGAAAGLKVDGEAAACKRRRTEQRGRKDQQQDRRKKPSFHRSSL